MDKNTYLFGKAKQIRKDVLESIFLAQDGHPGPSLGIVDILTVLYFDQLRIDSNNPDSPDRDRVILSKGHACPALYAVLADKGFFQKKELAGLRSYGSMLQGHPCISTPGIEMTSGSLGNGIAVGLGIDLSRKRFHQDYYTVVIAGDGELNEGVCWESITSAAQNNADHLIVIVDNNGFQSGGAVCEISGILPLATKFLSFGWSVQEIDGNDIPQIIEALENAKRNKDKPSVIIAKTIKGKGISFMENNNAWHKGKLTEEQYLTAIKELEGNCV